MGALFVNSVTLNSSSTTLRHCSTTWPDLNILRFLHATRGSKRKKKKKTKQNQNKTKHHTVGRQFHYLYTEFLYTHSFVSQNFRRKSTS